MPANRFRSRSYKRVHKNTPGGRNVLRYKKKNHLSTFVLSVVQYCMEFLADVHMKLENYQKQQKDLTVHMVGTYAQVVLVKFSKTRLENNDNYYRRIGWNWNYNLG